MNKPFRFVIWVVVALVVIGLGALWLVHSRGQSALTKYKAELRAKGEKLSYVDLGYPRSPLTNDTLPQLLAVAERLKQMKFQPGLLLVMDSTAPGRAELSWAGANPRFSTNAAAAVAAMSWPEFAAIFQHAEPELTEIRAGLHDPPRYWIIAPTNAFASSLNPFIPKRIIAQWLSGDVIAALHEGQLARAQTNLHALVQMVELHREEPTLVNQMIRIAVAGLALCDIWEALGAEGWTEPSLTALQADWEKLNLLEAIEIGISGDRVLGEEAVIVLRSASVRQRRNLMGWSVPNNQKKLEWYFNEWVVMPLWRLNVDADELFYLQHYQKGLEAMRQLSDGATWPFVNGELARLSSELNKLTASRLAAIKYWFSALAIPKTQRAVQTTVRTEMQRRLTITAISLERYRLRNGRYPPTLDALVPDFLPAIPIDLMSAKPLCYRLNPDGSFTLYSVGEDGQDDGGDAGCSATATSKFDLWSGKDAVWPVAVKK